MGKPLAPWRARLAGGELDEFGDEAVKLRRRMSAAMKRYCCVETSLDCMQ